jgi:o-succinylbenzoate synthase
MIRVTRVLEQRFALPRSGDAGDAPPASDARHVWNERATLLVVVEDSEGGLGLGEAAPLPGYSPDSLDEAWSVLAPLTRSLLVEGAAVTASELRSATETIASPSARFALESALVDLWARRRGEPAWALLARLRDELFGLNEAPTRPAETGCAVAALLPLGNKPALEHAERAFSHGVRCFKAKAGVPRAWSEELATLRALRRQYPDARLRVDANQSLSPEELWQRLPAFRELRLEWLEEPTAHFPDGIDWEVGVPLALDESLQAGAPDAAAARDHGVRAFVLKPTTLGGYLRSFALADAAARTGVAVVASHAYEGPLGFSAIAALSLALGADRPPDGLDRHAGVADAAVLPAFDTDQRRVRAWTEPGFGLALATLLERRPVAREASA